MTVFEEMIALRDGEIYKKVTLTVAEEKVVFFDYLMGDDIEKDWGDYDMEIWTTIKAAQYPALLFALLKEKYLGNLSASSDFASFCKEHGIQYDYLNWT